MNEIEMKAILGPHWYHIKPVVKLATSNPILLNPSYKPIAAPLFSEGTVSTKIAFIIPLVNA